MGHICQLLEMTSVFEIPIFVFRRNQRNNGYEKNDFQFLLFTVCSRSVCADYIGRMSAEDAGQLSAGTSVWFSGEDKGI